MNHILIDLKHGTAEIANPERVAIKHYSDSDLVFHAVGLDGTPVRWGKDGSLRDFTLADAQEWCYTYGGTVCVQHNETLFRLNDEQFAKPQPKNAAEAHKQDMKELHTCDAFQTSQGTTAYGSWMMGHYDRALKKVGPDASVEAYKAALQEELWESEEAEKRTEPELPELAEEEEGVEDEPLTDDTPVYCIAYPTGNVAFGGDEQCLIFRLREDAEEYMINMVNGDKTVVRMIRYGDRYLVRPEFLEPTYEDDCTVKPEPPAPLSPPEFWAVVSTVKTQDGTILKKRARYVGKDENQAHAVMREAVLDDRRENKLMEGKLVHDTNISYVSREEAGRLLNRY